jgi:hypothetical protein
MQHVCPSYVYVYVCIHLFLNECRACVRACVQRAWCWF